MNYLKLLKLTRSEPTGFSLLEIATTAMIVGVLAAIAIPNFYKSMELQYLKQANSQIYQAIVKAQTTSAQRRQYWQVSFRTSSGAVQYAVHQSNIDPVNSSSSVQWTSLPSQMTIDAETNLTCPTSGSTCTPSSSTYELCFTDQGVPSTVTGTNSAHTCTNPASFTPAQITLDDTNVTFSSTVHPFYYQRCVIISTILGALQTGQEQSSAQNGFYCY